MLCFQARLHCTGLQQSTIKKLLWFSCHGEQTGMHKMTRMKRHCFWLREKAVLSVSISCYATLLTVTLLITWTGCLVILLLSDNTMILWNYWMNTVQRALGIHWMCMRLPTIACPCQAVKTSRGVELMANTAQADARPKTPNRWPQWPKAKDRWWSCPLRSQKTRKKRSSTSTSVERPPSGDAASIENLSPVDSLASSSGAQDMPPSYESAVTGHFPLAPQHHQQQEAGIHGIDDIDMSADYPKAGITGHLAKSSSALDPACLNESPVSPQEWAESVTMCPSSAYQNIAGLHLQASPASTASPTPQCTSPMLSPPKKNLPLSPTHMQAMQQHAQLNQHQQLVQHSPAPYTQCSPGQYNESCQYGNSAALGPPEMRTAAVVAGPRHHHQYPTPPSQHSHLTAEHSSPQHISSVEQAYLTPSPDSPGQWSSSSPHSAHSDWSEAISSPPQHAPYNYQQQQQPQQQQYQVKQEPVYL